MRQDMKKVLCERPRHNSQNSYHDVRQKENRGDNDNLPSYQGMRRPYMVGWDVTLKEFSDLLGPLYRFLWGCVGRPWDEVWSEICKTVPAGKITNDHLRGHVLQEVEVHTHLEDGEVRVIPRYGLRAGEPHGLYVHPVTGLLCASATDRDNAYKYAPSEIVKYRGGSYTRDEDLILWPYNKGVSEYPIKELGDDDAIRIKGIWYRISYAQVPPPVVITYVEDGETKTKKVPHQRLDAVYGLKVTSGWYRSSKKQMSTRELRQHGLVNVP
jgi:hypothetical protein